MEGFHKVQKGMTMDEVTEILGLPNETRSLNFGAELLTTWVYQSDGKPRYVWFDQDGSVKIKSVE